MLKITRLSVLAVIAALVLTFAAGPAFGGEDVFAANGGCPSEQAAHGADHANGNSAHGPDKQADRGCVGQPPDPDPGI